MSVLSPSASAIIAQLGLQPLPREGGWFARTWTSRETLPNGARPAGTAIYFLLTPEDFSALHRLDADELWYFHGGDIVEHVQLPPNPDQPAVVTRLGANIAAGETPQLCVPAGHWQGARLASGAHHGWALMSCTMSPGWDETGFELGSRDALVARYPGSSRLISHLTRTF